MRTIALAMAVAFAWTGYQATTTATVQSEAQASQLKSTTCVTHPYPVREQRQLASRVFALKRWRDPHLKSAAVRRMHDLRRCAAPRALPSMRRGWQARRLLLYRYGAYRRVAPFKGYTDRGLWLTWLAIPRKIVSCESGGSWSAYNPSGAVSIYQLLGHGAPFPVRGWHDMQAHHRIAHELFVSQGTAPWAASRGCWG